MSRSRRKPYFTDGQSPSQGSRGTKAEAKRRAARATRRADIASGGAYKKAFNPWDICDWKFYAPDEPKARRK